MSRTPRALRGAAVAFALLGAVAAAAAVSR
jgi:hypothetical protein